MQRKINEITILSQASYKIFITMNVHRQYQGNIGSIRFTYYLYVELRSFHVRMYNQESRAIAGRTARCRCKFRYVSNFTISR